MSLDNNNSVKFCPNCILPACIESCPNHEHSHRPECKSCKISSKFSPNSMENYDSGGHTKCVTYSRPCLDEDVLVCSPTMLTEENYQSEGFRSLDHLDAEMAQGFGLETKFDYIDDLHVAKIHKPSQEGENLGSYLDDSVHQFVVYDSVLTDQLHESISTDSFYCDNSSFEHNKDLIFSTTNSKLMRWNASWPENKIRGRYFDSNSSYNLDLDVFSSPRHDGTPNKFQFYHEQRHSTPIKNKNSNDTNSFLSFEDIRDGDDDSDEDVDIEESYLETLWIGNGAEKLPNCNLLVKHLKENGKDELVHSMICKLDDSDSSSGKCLGLQHTKHEKAIVSDVGEDMFSEKDLSVSSQDEPLTLPHGWSSSVDRNPDASYFPPWNKMTYKDKLLEGLVVNPGKQEFVRNLRDKVTGSKAAVQSSVKEPSSDDASGNKEFKTHENNLTGNGLKKSRNTECYAQMKDGQWSEQRSKKNISKQVQNTLTPSLRTTSLNRTNGKICTKLTKASKDHSKLCDPNLQFSSDEKNTILQKDRNDRQDDDPTLSTILGEDKTTDKHQKNVISTSNVHEDRNQKCAKLPSQSTKRRKLKKFGSLDLSDFQEDSDVKELKNHRKWKSRDDLHAAPPSSLKVDNYLLWPILGIVVFAGFVAFCFRDKISFMIASKFPFERPPI